VTAFQRRQKILELLRERPTIRVTELVEIFEVSQGTIRNDLKALKGTEQVNRVRGGVEAREGYVIRNAAFLARMRVRADAKEWIASRAVDMVQDGDAIILDDSTTVFRMAPYLQDYRNLTILTNSLELAQALQNIPSHTVVLIGGVLRMGASSVNGQVAERALLDLHAKTAFISCAGFTPDVGLTEPDMEAARLKSRMISTAQQTVALIDASKFGSVHLSACAPLAQISHIITDNNVDKKYVDSLRETLTTVTVCGPDASSSTFTPVARSVPHFRIGFANMDEEMPFAVEVRRSVELAAQQAGNIDLTVADNRRDAELALRVADEMIAQKLDLVIEYQSEERAGGSLMDKFQRAGIPCIAVDVPMVGATFFGVDNYRAGHLAGTGLGQWIHRNWGGRLNRVLALESPRAGPQPAARIRGQLDGLQEVLGSLPAETIVYQDGRDTREAAAEEVGKLLARFPHEHRIAIIAVGDHIVIGALDAARQLGRERDIVAVSQGADRQIQRELHQPNTRVIGATSFRPEKYGEGLIALAKTILGGEPTPPAVYLELEFVTPENIDQSTRSRWGIAPAIPVM